MTTGYFNNSAQQTIDQTAEMNNVEDQKDFNASLWHIRNTYEVPTIGEVTQKYRFFKDLADKYFPEKGKAERREKALKNTETHYKVLTFNKTAPEPFHDLSHDDIWRD